MIKLILKYNEIAVTGYYVSRDNISIFLISGLAYLIAIMSYQIVLSKVVCKTDNLNANFPCNQNPHRNHSNIETVNKSLEFLWGKCWEGRKERFCEWGIAEE